MPDAAVGTALVRRPGPLLADGVVTHIERTAIDLDLAVRQWDAYCGALSDHGWHVVEVPPADDCPDAVFVEDTVVVLRGVAKVVESLGCPVARVHGPGTLEGGDVLKVGDTVYVGRGGRTNGEGIRQLAPSGPNAAASCRMPSPFVRPPRPT